MAWAAICHPKECGGLGLWQMYDVNLALIAKLAWSMYTQISSPWVQSLKAKYTGGKHLHYASARGSSSWVWQSLWHVRDLVAKGVCCLPGGGESIRIWKDPWVLSLPNFRPSPAQSVLSTVGLLDEEQLVCSLFDFESRCWKQDVLTATFDAASALAISQLPLLSPTREDQWLWTPDSKSAFSVAQAYRLTKPWSMHQHHPMSGKDWKKLWSLNLQDRLKLFLWKCLQAAIPVRGLCYLGSLMLRILKWGCVRYVGWGLRLLSIYFSGVRLRVWCGGKPRGLFKWILFLIFLLLSL